VAALVALAALQLLPAGASVHRPASRQAPPPKADVATAAAADRWTVPSDAQVTTVVQQLAAARAGVFAAADPALRDGVTVPGSPADQAARVAVATLRQHGLRYRGLALRTRSAHVRTTDDRTLVVDVVTDVSAYDVVDGRGKVSRREAARPGTTSRLVLVATSQGWRVQDARA
jgi:hypothetical protein